MQESNYTYHLQQTKVMVEPTYHQTVSHTQNILLLAQLFMKQFCWEMKNKCLESVALPRGMLQIKATKMVILWVRSYDTYLPHIRGKSG